MQHHVRLVTSIWENTFGDIWWFLKKPFCFETPHHTSGWNELVVSLGPLTAYSSCKLNVFWHDRYTFCVDGAQVRVLKQSNQVSFRCLLKSHYSRTLEAQVCLEVLSDLSDQTLEGQLPDQQFCRLLISSDFSQGHSTWSVPVRFLHSSSGRGAFSCSFRCKLLSRCFSSSRFSCCLLRTSHFFKSDYGS